MISKSKKVKLLKMIAVTVLFAFVATLLPIQTAYADAAGAHEPWIEGSGIGLRYRAIPTARELVHVDGYWSIYDGGGGDFVWNSGSTASDNGGTVITPISNPAAGRWIRIFQGAYNILWFGAKGDGVTDDAPKIQNLINDAKNASLEPDQTLQIIIPKGTYKLGSAITFPSTVRLVFLPGAKLKLVDNVAVTLNCSIDAAMNQQIFDFSAYSLRTVSSVTHSCDDSYPYGPFWYYDANYKKVPYYSRAHMDQITSLGSTFPKLVVNVRQDTTTYINNYDFLDTYPSNDEIDLQWLVPFESKSEPAQSSTYSVEYYELTLAGTPKVDRIYPQWFGAVEGSGQDNFLPFAFCCRFIQQMTSQVNYYAGDPEYFPQAEYIVQGTFYSTKNFIFPSEVRIQFNNACLVLQNNKGIVANFAHVVDQPHYNVHGRLYTMPEASYQSSNSIIGIHVGANALSIFEDLRAKYTREAGLLVMPSHTGDKDVDSTYLNSMRFYTTGGTIIKGNYYCSGKYGYTGCGSIYGGGITLMTIKDLWVGNNTVVEDHDGTPTTVSNPSIKFISNHRTMWGINGEKLYFQPSNPCLLIDNSSNSLLNDLQLDIVGELPVAGISNTYGKYLGIIKNATGLNIRARTLSGTKGLKLEGCKDVVLELTNETNTSYGQAKMVDLDSACSNITLRGLHITDTAINASSWTNNYFTPMELFTPIASRAPVINDASRRTTVESPIFKNYLKALNDPSNLFNLTGGNFTKYPSAVSNTTLTVLEGTALTTEASSIGASGILDSVSGPVLKMVLGTGSPTPYIHLPFTYNGQRTVGLKAKYFLHSSSGNTNLGISVAGNTKWIPFAPSGSGITDDMWVDAVWLTDVGSGGDIYVGLKTGTLSSNVTIYLKDLQVIDGPFLPYVPCCSIVPGSQ